MVTQGSFRTGERPFLREFCAPDAEVIYISETVHAWCRMTKTARIETDEIVEFCISAVRGRVEQNTHGIASTGHETDSRSARAARIHHDGTTVVLTCDWDDGRLADDTQGDCRVRGVIEMV